MQCGQFSVGRRGKLDEDVRGLLEKATQSDAAPFSTLSPDEARAEFRRRLDKANVLPPDDVQCRDIVIGGGLRLRLYEPGAKPAKAALLFFHGGGFVVGDLETHDAVCRVVASRTATVVAAVDYRLAPEHPYPAAVEDAARAFDWACGDPPELAGAGRVLGLCGDSAGGTLTAVTAIRARDLAVQNLAIQILVYPAVDQGGTYASRTRFGEGHLLGNSEIDWFRRQTFGSDIPVLDWPASPLRAPSHQGVAPAVILTAGHDPLADEGAAYAQRLAAAGVKVRHVCLEGSVHGCLSMARFLASGRTALDEVCRAWAGAAKG